MKNYEILNFLKNSKSICILGHLDPDADSLSSMVVLKNFLESKLDVKIDLFAYADKIVDNCQHIVANENFNKKPKDKYDTAIALDSTNSDRLDRYENLFTTAKNKIVIDHHSTNPKYGDLNIVEITSSTCEIIYKILKHYNYNFSVLDYELLYSGIITDTNNFTTPSTSKETHNIVGEICEHINISNIYNKFFSNFSMKNMNLFATSIQNILSIDNNKIIITYVEQDDLDKLDATNNDLTGIVNRLTQIENNILTCFIQPKGHDLNYVSLRAKNGFNVAEVAKKFDGGGHVGASGFISNLPQKIIIEIISKEFINLLNQKS